MKIVVASDGTARIEETLHFKLLYGGWKGLDLPGLEANATPDGEATITSIEGGSVPANLSVSAPGTFRLDALDPKGVKKGDYAAHFAYRVDLVDAHEIHRDGALWRVDWTAAAPHEGVDGMRVVFDFPAAPTEPAAIDDGTDLASGFLATLRRSGDKDELDLVRPHVARGEATTWSARIDPKGLGAVKDPTLRPAPVPRAKEIDDPFARFGTPWRAAIAVALGLGFFAVARKRNAEAKAAKKKLASLLFVPAALATFLAAPAYAIGVWLEITASPRSAIALFALATAFAAMRILPQPAAPRGPGAWKILTEAKVLKRAPAMFDVRTLRGFGAFALFVATTVLLSIALRKVDENAWLSVVPAAVPWLAFWLSGARESFGDAVAAGVRLRPLFKALRRGGARVAPTGRIPTGRKDVDDVRLLVVPGAALPGLVGIEVAVGWVGTTGGYGARYEVLVRARDASAAAAKMGGLAAFAKPFTGRKLGERVYVLSPRDSSAKSAVDLVLASAKWLVDRRVVAENEWAGAERRKPILAPLAEPRAA
ncbi:MAG TPA: hypothetical protein VF407_02905 [Polyangiaceae bacterium]